MAGLQSTAGGSNPRIGFQKQHKQKTCTRSYFLQIHLLASLKNTMPGIAERQLGNISKVFIYAQSEFAGLALRDPRKMLTIDKKLWFNYDV